jgi:hypothetical protein
MVDTSATVVDKSASGTTMMNSTSSLDESKVVVTVCLKVSCNIFGHGWQDCYCCEAKTNGRFFPTLEKCRQSCPSHESQTSATSYRELA